MRKGALIAVAAVVALNAGPTLAQNPRPGISRQQAMHQNANFRKPKVHARASFGANESLPLGNEPYTSNAYIYEYTNQWRYIDPTSDSYGIE